MKTTTTYLRKLQTSGLLLLLLCCGALGASGQADAPMEILWDKTYGGDDSDQLVTMVATEDGGFLLGGGSSSDAGFEKSEDARGKSDMWIVRLDAQANQLWDKTYGGTADDGINAILPTPDGGFLLGGSSDSNASFEKSEDRRDRRPYEGYQDFWVVRIDAQGDILWDKTFGGDTHEAIHTMALAPDGGFLLGGWSDSRKGFDKSEDDRGYMDYWIVKIDTQGGKLWDKTYGGTNDDLLSSMVATADGGFLLGGLSRSNEGFEKSEDSRGGYDYWVVRIDAQGNKLWDKTYGGRDTDILNSMVATADGGFLLGGGSSSDAGFEKSEDTRRGNDYWVVRIDKNGNKLWDKTYGGFSNDLLKSITPTPDHGFLLGGQSKSNIGFEKSEDRRGSHEYWDYWFVRIDAQGNLHWDKTVGGPDNDLLNKVALSTDNGIWAVGRSLSPRGGDKTEDLRGGYDESNYDGWLVKVDFLYKSSGIRYFFPNKYAAPSLTTLDLYGNPFNENSTVTLFRDGQTKTPDRYTMLSQYKAQCLFDFAEADTGVWSVAVTFNDTITDTLFDALTLEPLEPFSPCVQIAGEPEARAERWNTYHFAISNTSNGDRQGVPVWIALPDTGAEYEISFQVAGGNPLDTAW